MRLPLRAFACVLLYTFCFPGRICALFFVSYMVIAMTIFANLFVGIVSERAAEFRGSARRGDHKALWELNIKSSSKQGQQFAGANTMEENEEEGMGGIASLASIVRASLRKARNAETRIGSEEPRAAGVGSAARELASLEETDSDSDLSRAVNVPLERVRTRLTFEEQLSPSSPQSPVRRARPRQNATFGRLIRNVISVRQATARANQQL